MTPFLIKMFNFNTFVDFIAILIKTISDEMNIPLNR